MNKDAAATTPAGVGYDPFAHGPLARVVPITEPQREVWLADQLGIEGSLAYNESVSLRLCGALEVDALCASVHELCERHESLRATVGPEGDALCIAELGRLDIARLDLSGLEPAARHDAVAARQRAAVETPFDLEAGPLVRAELLKFGEGQHVLILTAHHIVCDGWSFGVLMRDLAAVYARRVGEPADEPAQPGSFADYSIAQMEWSRSAESHADEHYWLSRFDDQPPPLELPLDGPRPRRRTFAAGREDVLLKADLVVALRRLGASHGASLFATVFTGLCTLMRRLSGECDVVVGIAAAGQSLGGHDALVGHCVNILPVRSRAEPGTGFDEVLHETGDLLLDAFEHQRYTFGTLLRKLAVARDPGRLPLVSVLLNLDQALDADTLRFPGLTADLRANPRSYESFELFVNAVPVAGGLRLECQYNRDLYAAQSVRRWMGLLDQLLQSAVANPQTPWDRLDWLPAAEVQALAALQPPPTPFDTTRLVHQRIAAQAAQTPDRVAVVFGSNDLSYTQLDQRANAIAHALRARGIGREALVGVCLERNPDLYAALIGVLKSGAGFVPLDPTYPNSRLSFMAADAGLAALVTTTALHAAVDYPRAQTLMLDADLDQQAWARVEPVDDDDRSATADSSAYVIHTSGSTGKPKGVVVPHRCLINLLCSMQRAPGLSPHDRLVAVTTMSFDISMLELFLPLIVGARVVLAGSEDARAGDALRLVLETSGATAMQATPSGWRVLLDAGWGGAPGFKALVGGETLPQDLALALCARCDEVWNLYGPTETTIWSTCCRVQEPVAGVPIGTPIANTSVWVLDAHGESCPIGVAGEIWIGGDGVTAGYLNQPALTAERYLPDSRALQPGARAYRSGDRGRWRSDGMLEHLGRLDQQVKVRGYRIEPGEIETQLGSHPDVARCAVITREDRPGDVRLIGYVVTSASTHVADASQREAALREHLRATLPPYMLPQQIVFLDAMPLTPNGKLDRKALPAPDPGAQRRLGHVAPRTELERKVAAVMEQVLALPDIGVDEDFFALGGHSLLAAQLTSRLNRELDVALSMRVVFDAPTVAGLADFLASGSAPKASSPIPVLRRTDQHRAPLSLAQERLWLLEEFNPGQLSYHLPSAHRLLGPLDVDAFARAFDALIQHQAVLRTSIGRDDGIPTQVVHDQVASGLLPVEDLSSLPEEQRKATLTARTLALTEQPFDLSQAPLFRARLFKLDEQVHILFFMPHHIIWDGWSFDLLYAELAELYAAALQTREPRLAELPASYADFAVWHRQWVHGPEYRRQLAFWRERLGSGDRLVRPQPLPTDKPRRPGMSGRGGSQGIWVGHDLIQALRAAGLRMEATLFVVLITAYFALLNQATGQRELIVGTPVRGRDRAEFENVMGYFTNLVPLRVRIDPARPFAEAVRDVKAAVLDAFAHPDVRLEDLARELNLRDTAGGAVLYQSLFSFQDFRQRTVQWGNVKHEHMPYFQPGATEDLGLWFAEDHDGMLGGLIYNTEIFHKQTADLFRERYLKLLETVAADPLQSIDSMARFDDGRPMLIGNPGEMSLQPVMLASMPKGVSQSPGASVILDSRVQYLVGLWSEILATPVRPEENFFDRGGNSMLGVEMAVRVARDTGVRLNLINLASQNLEQIAAVLPEDVAAANRAVGPGAGMFHRVKRLFGRTASKRP